MTLLNVFYALKIIKNTLYLLFYLLKNNFPSENESIGLSDPVYKGWLFCFSHIVFVFLFGVTLVLLVSLTPVKWRITVLRDFSRFFQFPIITDICIFVQFFALSPFFDSLLQFSFYWLLRRILVNILIKVFQNTSWNIQVYKLSHCYHLILLIYSFNKYS